MTKDILPGSRNKNYANQQKMIVELGAKSLIGYEVPGTLEATACILSQYFGSNIRLFSDDPWTYTHCKEKVEDGSIVVGGFTKEGLDVDNSSYIGSYLGVAALRKFEPLIPAEFRFEC
jgi:hypothetical protein